MTSTTFPTSQKDDTERLAAIRAQLPAATSTAYLNAGSFGPLSTVALNVLSEAAQTELDRGRIAPGTYDRAGEFVRTTRATIASIFNAQPTEIGLMSSTTEGLNVALMGIEWRRGDEVITTQLEHICLFSVLGLLAHRHGVIIRTVDIGNGGGDVLAAIESAITPRTRAIAMSHIQWSSGAIMPLKAITAMARSRGILTIIDAAQSAGQFPIDLPDLGVDAYAMAGQKWLCGPGGTGALYVRKDRLGDIRPTYLRYGVFDPHGFVVPPEGSARFEMGDMYSPVIQAFNAGLSWIRDDITFAWAHARIAYLGQKLAAGLAAIDGVAVNTPLDRMAGLVCFNVLGIPPKTVSDDAFERGYTVRSVDQRPGPAVVRASTGWWCTDEEVAGLIDTIRAIAREARA